MDETRLTKSEYEALETFLAHAKEKRDLSEVLMQFNPNGLDRILSATQKIVSAFEIMDWKPADVSPSELEGR